MGRRPNTDLRRAQIIEALLAEMSAVGYQRATTKSIAARAGLAAGLLHYHFSNKEAILLALVDGLIADADCRLHTALQDVADPAAALRAYVSCRVGLGASADAAQLNAWVQLIAEGSGQGPVRARLGSWLSQERAQLQILFEGAGVESPAASAAALLAMVMGSFSLHAMAIDGLPSGYAEQQMLQWLDHVAAPQKAGRNKRNTSRQQQGVDAGR